MNNRYQLVVFDWEGTLADNFGKVIALLKEESQRLGLGAFSECEARGFLMMGLSVAIKKIFPDITLYQCEELIERVNQSQARRSNEVYLYNGVESFLNQLGQTGIDLAIATNRGQQSLQRDLQYSGLAPLFSVTRAAGQMAPKPNPDMLIDIMDVCGAVPSNTLMVGDSVIDIEMANSINVPSFGVNFCNQSEVTEALLDAGAVKVFDNYQAIADALHLTKFDKDEM